MPSDGSVSHLIAQMKVGDETAFANLHRRYWPRIVQIAGRRLQHVPRGNGDAEDMAQRAFIDLYRSFEQQRVPDLNHRHQLLALLSHIVARRVMNLVRAEAAQRRGGTEIRTIPGLSPDTAVDTAIGPVDEAILHDCYEFYLNSVPENLRQLAELHLAGFTNREIASRMNCVERTIERKIALLRRCWRSMAGSSMARETQDLL